MQGRGVTQITDVGGVAKLYPQLAKELDGSAINLLYVYSKTYLTSDEFVPDVNPHYIAHDLHHIFELQNRNREVGGVGEDKFKKIIMQAIIDANGQPVPEHEMPGHNPKTLKLRGKYRTAFDELRGWGSSINALSTEQTPHGRVVKQGEDFDRIRSELGL